jgi:murein DD-endopeptidase MepM/ murein hydrolase activator NlpD
MAKHKYKFNPESLSYIKIARSTREKLYIFLSYFSASVVLSILYFIIFSAFFDSPKEKGLKRQISELKVNYQIVNEELHKIETILQDLQERDDNIYRTIFEAEPVHSSIREAGSGGSDQYRNLKKLENSELVISVKSRLDKIMKKMYVQSTSYDQIIELAKNKEDMLDLKRTASGWGWRIHPIYKIRKFHYGMDFTAPTGTDVYATGDGVVEFTQSSMRGYGNELVINHGYGYKTLYGHLNGFNVKQGQHIHRGDVIGFVGSTGLSTAPHLHYEVIHNDEKVNPVNYYFNDLTPREYEDMIEISIKSGQSFD